MKKGFTLMEVLAVIVIFGILAGIGIGAYSNYMTKSRKKSYNIAEVSLKDAATSAITDCLTENGKNRDFCKTHDILENQYEHEIVLLEELINDDYINPIRDPYDTENFCNTGNMEENGSYVYIMNKTNTENVNNIDFDYKVCLKCGDYSSKDCLENVDSTYEFNAYCNVTYEDGKTYNGEWTDKDLYLTLTTDSGFRYGLKYFLYQIDNGKQNRVEHTENKAVVKLDSTIDNKEIMATAIDGLGTEAKTKCGDSSIKIDKEKMISATLSGNLRVNGKKVTNGGWAGDNVILKVSTNPTSVPSGYYYEWYHDGKKIAETTKNTYTVEATTDNGKIHRYQVRVTNGLKNQEVWTNEIKIKFDKTKPTIKAINSPISLANQDYNFIDNVTYTFGISGGETICKPSISRKTGVYNVTCVANGNNGLSAQVVFTARHSYPATYVPQMCDGGCQTHYSYCQYIDQGDTAGNHMSCNCGSETHRETNDVSGQCCKQAPPYDCSYYWCPQGGKAIGATCYY